MREKMPHIIGWPFRMMLFFLLSFFLIPLITYEQCSLTISNFPYNENFETSNGNWVTGGSFSDWAWGTPSKPVISSAGTGLKCWITGGLNKKNYNDGENAWLQSPCFNFTNLKGPSVTFKVFWETEGKYDGADLQYSIDNGATWQVTGSSNETGNCRGENWYNFSSLANSYVQDAWSGNIQTSHPGCIVSGGSAGWKIAKHTIPNLAGKPNVIFRFVFVSGTSCNDFDGFAVDDFIIQEAPGSVASFTYDCSSSLRVNFKSTSTLCPESYSWNFGDAASGADNISTSPNPTHAYTLGGIYHVSLTVSGPGNNTSTFTLPNLKIIGNLAATVVSPIRCNGDTTGSLTVNFSGDTSEIYFNWDSDPVQNTQTATHLGAGDYNVTILNSQGCPASANIKLTEPPPMLYTLTTGKPNCTVNNGSIDISMSGGLPPYSYNWYPDVSKTSSAKNLAAGIYTVIVTDNNMCNKTITIDLPALGDLKADISKQKDATCFGKTDGMAVVTATGGNMPYTYSWPSGTKGTIENNLAAGSYIATVIDAKGCKAFATAIIHQPGALSSVIKLQNTSCGINNGSAAADVDGGTGPYQFIWTPGNYTNASVSNLAAGKYFVSIKDSNGCIKNDSAFIAASGAVHLQLSHTDVLCAGDSTASAEAIVTGGTMPYKFKWTDGIKVFNENVITNIGAGNYNFTAEDATGCIVTSSVIINQPGPLKVMFATHPSYCNFNNGSANANVSGGIAPYAYTWSPVVNTTSALTNVNAGNYKLTVTDKNGCTVNLLTTIPNTDPPPIFLGNDTTLCPGSRIILAPGIFSSYRWQDNSSQSIFTVTDPGTYAVHVKDALGCVIKDTIIITGDCGYIFFPTAFTPNNDRRNDLFGPFGNLNIVKDYTLVVSNRWGQIVFTSNDPFKKWDGKLKNNGLQPGTYTWIARYSNKGVKNIVQKGTVTIVY